MDVILLKSKIHQAVVTESSLNYEGSITIDAELMKKANILPNEKVLVANITRGTRFQTYAIPGKANSGIIRLNGAAARLGSIGDRLTIMAFAVFSTSEAKRYKPKIVIVDHKNKVKKS